MSGDTSIQWTDATWNPLTGCTKLSPGCAHCYIESTPPFRMAHRKFVNGSTGVLLHPERLSQPLRWRKPKRIFVNSLSDLFHEDVPDWFIARTYGVMVAAYWHTFQVLTKRPERRRELLNNPWFRALVATEVAALILDRWHWRRGPESARNLAAWNAGAAPNIWEGVSTENQRWADIRIPELMATPAAVRFISAEPLLGPIDLTLGHKDFSHWERGSVLRAYGDVCWLDADDGLDWVIVGGESGPKARPMDIAWPRSLRDQCQAAGVPVFVKQLGRRPMVENYDANGGTSLQQVPMRDSHGGDMAEWAEDLRVREMPEVSRLKAATKRDVERAAGHLLDARAALLGDQGSVVIALVGIEYALAALRQPVILTDEAGRAALAERVNGRLESNRG